MRNMRLGSTFFCFFFLFVVLVYRLLQIQVFPNEKIKPIKKQDSLTYNQYRGIIRDKQGIPLSLSIPKTSIAAYPNQIHSPHQLISKVEKHFTISPKKKKILKEKKKPFLYLKRFLTDNPFESQYNDIKKLRGVDIISELKRVYPHKNTLAQTIGFTSIDQKGLSGLELEFDSALSKGSKELNLTIDLGLQYLIEKKVKATQKELSSKSISVIVMNPYTGAITALSETPSYDPNSFQKYRSIDYRSISTSSLFEPGSTMKPLMAAYALEKGYINSQSLINCDNGKLLIQNKWITESTPGVKYKELTPREIIKVSSNVGAAKIALLMGEIETRQALQLYGFDKKTGIEIPGEASQKLSQNWSDLKLANVGFGQGIAVTPIQMISSYAILINGGYQVFPRVALQNLHQKLKRVLKPSTSHEIKSYLRSVVAKPYGTGRAANVSYMTVGGKTGTAQKYIPQKGYQGGKYVSSFIGFFPYEEPQYLVGVFIDEPQKHYYAPKIAVPLFKEVMDIILSKYPMKTHSS